LLVEPKIKALFDGKLLTSNTHDEVILTLKGNEREKRYIFRKSDVAKASELAGVGGKVESKIFLPYSHGTEIKAEDSIAELIKDAWNIPNHIHYASEIRVEDGAPITQVVKADAKGKLQYFILKGDYLEPTDGIKKGEPVEEKGLFALIADKGNREASRHYISRGSIIQKAAGENVDRGEIISSPKDDTQIVIAEWDPHTEPIIAEDDGVVKFEDIIPGVTATEQYDEVTGYSRLELNEYIPSVYKPAIVLGKADYRLIRYHLGWPKHVLICCSDWEEVPIRRIFWVKSA